MYISQRIPSVWHVLVLSVIVMAAISSPARADTLRGNASSIWVFPSGPGEDDGSATGSLLLNDGFEAIFRLEAVVAEDEGGPLDYSYGSVNGWLYDPDSGDRLYYIEGRWCISDHYDYPIGSATIYIYDFDGNQVGEIDLGLADAGWSSFNGDWELEVN